ncbi:MAG TPA: hypothetical protein VL285_13285 [Bryobacteraceae bacterium]|jgi:hypothetical protein|nr:hypothetical protein [Bryobacteraceae bacterium]
MAKIIFTPFSVREAGQLANRLEYSDRIQEGMAADKTGHRGFKRNFGSSEVKYAPLQQNTGQLAHLTGPDDQLYINAHCAAGFDFVANREKVDEPGAKQVNIETLIRYLKWHNLPETTKCKIKLWICEGGLDGAGGKPSFAKLFSAGMHEAGYKLCRIFGYAQSLLAQYERVEEPVAGSAKPKVNFHKMAVLDHGKPRTRASSPDVRKEFFNGQMI